MNVIETISVDPPIAADARRRPSLQMALQGPRSIVRYLRDLVRLALVPTRSFDPASLPLDDIGRIQAALNDPEIGRRWAMDHDQVCEAYPTASAGGGVNPGDRRAIYSLIAAFKPQKVLEVGTHVGSSTLFIARALQSASPSGRVTTVDIFDVNAPTAAWSTIGLAMSPLDYAKAIGCEDVIDFEVAPALTFMENTSERFDLVFLDGDHQAHAVYEEVSAALKILRPGGLLLLHDYYPGGRPLFPSGIIVYGPYVAMQRVMREQPLIRVRPLGSLPWPTKLGTNTTSLALVMRQAA